MPNDALLTGSIELVVSIRHQWAHQYRYGAKVIKSAKDVKLAVSDCLTFAQKLTQEVVSLRP